VKLLEAGCRPNISDVLTASSGAEGAGNLRAAAEATIILLDVMMPEHGRL